LWTQKTFGLLRLWPMPEISSNSAGNRAISWPRLNEPPSLE
jgi:hypothetical protein